jgi:hypothetical protein
MSGYYDEDKTRYPDDLDEFTLELMIGIVGEKNMLFDSEIEERHKKQLNANSIKPSIKDRFESAKIESKGKSQCKSQEKNSCKER